MERWRELCFQITEERDPERFSEMAGQLLQELEDRKKVFRSTKNTKPAPPSENSLPERNDSSIGEM